MPRPPILPAIDWEALFHRGLDGDAWLAAAENVDHAVKMRERLRTLPVPSAVDARLRALSRPVHVIAIAEDWCGDVVRHVPVLLRMAVVSPLLRVRFITRMESPEAFARFLTNGGEAIPKFIFLNARWVETGNWGPMPAASREVIARGKACGDLSAAREIVSRQYEADPECAMVFDELAQLAGIAATPSMSA